MKIKRIINGETRVTRAAERAQAEALARDLYPNSDHIHAGLTANGSEVYVEVWKDGKASIHVYEAA